MKSNISKHLGKIFLCGIIFVAFIVRFYQLDTLPPSLYWDEISQGMNAYSIAKTGHDEHKELFPLVTFKAYGDYKAPIYIYLDVVVMMLLGKSDFAVRFPSALLGSLTVVVAFFLARELFYNHKRRDLLSGMTAFFLAISPWHIQLSRAAYEANVATFFTVFAVLLFFLAQRTKKILYVVSSVSFVLGFYSFNAHRIFIPLLVVLIIWLFRKEIIFRSKEIILSFVVGLMLLIPFLFYLRTPESRLRFAEVNIFSDIAVIEESNKLVNADQDSAFSRIVHNRRVLYGLSYINHYLDFYNPSYLFFKGDVNPRFSTQHTGQLYLYMLPLILIGIYVVAKTNNKIRLFLFGWLLLAPLAAATARETPHALRSETFIPLFELFAGLGFVVLVNKITPIKLFGRKIIFGVLVAFGIVVLYYFVNFIHAYSVYLPLRYSQDFQYGYKQAIEKVEKIIDQYDVVYFSNSYGRAYAYVVWYGNYSPQEYWKEGSVERDVFGFYNVHGFGKYNFEKPVNGNEKRRVLYVVPPNESPTNTELLDTIKFLNGSTAFEIRKNQL